MKKKKARESESESERDELRGSLFVQVEAESWVALFLSSLSVESFGRVVLSLSFSH